MTPLRALRLALTIVCVYAVFDYVTALLMRRPYYQNFLIASIAMALAMAVVIRAKGFATGVAASLAVLLVHFGLAWLGIVLTSGNASHLLKDFVAATIVTVLVGIPYAVFLDSRRPTDTSRGGKPERRLRGSRP